MRFGRRGIAVAGRPPATHAKREVEVEAYAREEPMMNASDLMTPDPATIDPQASVAEVWDLMRELEIRHVPVVERGVLVGMVSDRDLAHFDIGRVLVADGAEALRRQLGTPVVKIMSADVVSVSPDADMTDIIELLVENKVGAVPVVRGDTREVVGIVSYVDVLRAVQELVEEE
jgi:acetoin utilization protein AcuB